jgi:hypothetical protein
MSEGTTMSQSHIQILKFPHKPSRPNVAVQPDLLDALRGLARCEGYPTVDGFVAILVNEALDHRLAQEARRS